MKDRLPFSLYNALLCVLATVVMILFCLCVQAAEERYYLKWDVSADGVSQLSDYTEARLAALSEDVTVYSVYAPATTSDLRDLQTETLLRMASRSSLVRLETLDPASEPQRLRELAGDETGIAEGTLFVQSGKRTVRLEPDGFVFSRRLEDEVYTIYCGEARLIGAIEQVTSADTVTAWFAEGHGEASEKDCTQLALRLRTLGFEVQSGALGVIEPQAGDVLFLIGMQSDLTPNEAKALVSFLENGGNVVLALGADQPELPALSEVCALYGLGFESGWVVESAQETARYVDRPEWLSPALSSENGVMDALPGRLILPRVKALQTPETRPDVAATVLLETSTRAIRKQDIADEALFQAGDETGKQLLGVYAEVYAGHLLQLGSADMLLDDERTTDASENIAFLVSCLEQMTERGLEANLDAGVKQLPAQLITFENEQQRRTVSLALIAVLPLCVLAVMIPVLIKRRRM